MNTTSGCWISRNDCNLCCWLETATISHERALTHAGNDSGDGYVEAENEAFGGREVGGRDEWGRASHDGEFDGGYIENGGGEMGWWVDAG